MPSQDEERPLLRREDDYQPTLVERLWAALDGASVTEKVLGAASVLLLALVAVFVSMYVSAARHVPPAVPTGPDDLCLTSECVVGAAAILGSLNTKASPCDNFYEFACGGWTEANPIPDAKSRISSFDNLSQRNSRLLRRLLESPYARSPSTPPRQEDQDRANFGMVRDLYATCLNESAIDAAGAAPLVALLAELDSKFAVDAGKGKKGAGLAAATAFVHDLGISALISLGVTSDLVDPDTNAVYVGQGSLSLPAPEYYDDADTVAVLHGVVAELMARVLPGGPPAPHANWTAAADAVVALEKRLAKITLPADQLQDPNATYNPTKVRDIAAVTPSFPWTEYLALRLPASAFPGAAAPNSTFVVETPSFFADLEGVLQGTDQADLRLLYAWRVARGYAGALGELYREPGKRLREKLTGVKTDLPRWETCLSVVDDYLGQIEGKLFVDAAFGGESREAASRAIDGIKQAMIERIPQLSWIDHDTQGEAIAKVQSLKRKIGFPDFTLDPVKLRARYAGLEINDTSYFANVLAGNRWQESDNLAKIMKAVDRTEWDMTPQTVNAYYNPPMNEIVFPAGILQPPFFTAGLPSYLNYGGIGSVVGHELTHAFDNNGREFDKEGKLRDWWGEETSRNFEERSQCFVNQYGNFTVAGPDGKEVHVNGKLTLGENLADVGGISRAFEAWRADAATSDGAARNFLLPGLQSFTREQLFFVSFAQVWCSAVRPAAAVQRIRTDPHSPPVYRVLGAIRDTAQFKLAFGCSGPSPQCLLW